MGKSAKKIKRQQQQRQIQQVLHESGSLERAYAKRLAEVRKEGKAQGIEEMIILFSQWTEEVSEHVKGIGDKKQADITMYFAECLKTYVDSKLQHTKDK